VSFIKPLPPRANQPAGDILSAAHEQHLYQERTDSVATGETLVGVLARGGVTEVLAREALKAATMLDPRRIPAGMRVSVRSANTDTLPNEIILRLAVDRLLHLRRGDSGWTAQEERLPWKTDTIVVSAVVKANLYEAIDNAARDWLPSDARQSLTWTLADVYEYKVDMTRDLQVGDSFRVLAERKVGPDGIVRIGDIIAATAKLSGTTLEAIRFHSASVRGDFFDANGKSLRAGFLRNPVQFRRISSGYGMRMHPILGYMRKHEGTDYAAAAGTPVRSIGDGVVTRAGWSNGYGNLLEIRHRNGIVTKYGHMLRFAKGVHAGARVTMAQEVGYVGSTGLSTAPHLHFEVLVNGVNRNPRTALQNASSDPVPANERVAFAARRTELLAQLESQALLATADNRGGPRAGPSPQ
jgi:murein DD-endopeptidase MepM/ murein hydrolase activator NlpD